MVFYTLESPNTCKNHKNNNICFHYLSYNVYFIGIRTHTNVQYKVIIVAYSIQRKCVSTHDSVFEEFFNKKFLLQVHIILFKWKYFGFTIVVREIASADYWYKETALEIRLAPLVFTLIFNFRLGHNYILFLGLGRI